MRYLPLILKNSWRNRRRTLLTIASIGVSMCLLGLMISLYHAFYLSAPAPEQAQVGAGHGHHNSFGLLIILCLTGILSNELLLPRRASACFSAPVLSKVTREA